MNAEDTTLTLYAQGTRVASASHITVDVDERVGGRAVVIGQIKLPLELQVAVTFDPAEIAAIHARTTYGFAALRAMLDSLPQCSTVPTAHQAVATHQLVVLKEGVTGRQPLCGSCADAARVAGHDVTELASAPAVRHIEAYVRAWETEHTVPEGER